MNKLTLGVGCGGGPEGGEAVLGHSDSNLDLLRRYQSLHQVPSTAPPADDGREWERFDYGVGVRNVYRMYVFV